MTKSSSQKTALMLVAIVLFMVGLSFAAVPLYRIFCQVTGFGGTTSRAEALPDHVLAQTIKVRFNADTARGLSWRFLPKQTEIEAQIGAGFLIFYEAENLSDRPITGMATFNVAPDQAGRYFHKIECFCFTEQRLEPGQKVEMPVSFYIDPEIVNDSLTQNLDTITLSYTFFEAKE